MKRSDKNRRAEQMKRLKYRWEFMRRNPEYREAYKEVKKLRAEFSPRGLRKPEEIRAYLISS